MHSASANGNASGHVNAPTARQAPRRNANLAISLHGLQRGSSSMRSKDSPLRVCCNAMLSAYAHSAPVQALRAQHVLSAMLRCAPVTTRLCRRAVREGN